MTSRFREALAPLYLFACLLLGGSAQGAWGNMLLQLGGIAIIFWSALAKPEEPIAPAARHLLALAAVGIAFIALQLVPLPPSFWPGLGGRAELASGYRLLGLQIPTFPISLTPYKTLDSLVSLIPALAMVCAIVRLRAYRPNWIAIALIAAALAGILLGALQVASAGEQGSHWYLYKDTNYGLAVGFFANANHMATLLVVTLPFLAAIAFSARRSSMQRRSAIIGMAAAFTVVILVGILINGSLAGYGLMLPVAIGSVLILMSRRSPLRNVIALGALLLLLVGIGLMSRSAIGSSKIGEDAHTSSSSRAVIWSTTQKAIADFMPFGSGLGSFRQVYPLYENAHTIDPTIIVHAHNDYLELALELGIGGILIILAFFGWWSAAVWRVWRSAEAGPYVRAASIASAAMLAHSVVDFPLRETALSACFAMCVALIADRRGPPPPVNESDLRPTRHYVFR